MNIVTTDEVTEFLSRARNLEQELDQHLQQIQIIRSLAEKVTTSYKATGGGHSDGCAMENNAIRLVQEEHAVRETITALLEAINDIRQLISELDDNQLKAILISHYLNYRTWTETAEALHYSETHIYRLHNRALEQLAVITSRESGKTKYESE